MIITPAAASNISAIHDRSVDRIDGERSSLKTKHSTLTDPAVRQALALLVDKDSVEKYIYGRTGKATANFVNNPERFRSKTATFEFNIDKANALLDKAGWVKGADGIRAKDGKKLKSSTRVDQPAAAEDQAIVKQACQKAGIDIEVKAVTASVFFSSDVANPDTYTKFYCDLQMYNNGPQQPDPEVFLRQFLSVEAATKENKWQGRNITRWQSKEYDDIHKAASSTRSRQARRHADQAERDGGEQPGRDPRRRPTRGHGRRQQPRGRADRLGQQHVGLAELVQGESRIAPRLAGFSLRIVARYKRRPGRIRVAHGRKSSHAAPRWRTLFRSAPLA